MKYEEKTPKISDPFMAGREEEKAARTLCQTDRGAQSRRPTAFLEQPQEPAMFDELVQRVEPRTEKHDSKMRKALPPGLKLAITVRFLASGDKYPSLMYSFRAARNTISFIIPEVCQTIMEEYNDEAITCPTSLEESTPIGEVFADRWNVPHAMGALDGSMLPLGNLPRAAPCTTVTRASSLLFSWPLWTETTISCGWTSVNMEVCLMLRSSTTQ